MNDETETKTYRSPHLEEVGEEDPRFYNLIRGDRKGYHMLEIVREDDSYICVSYHDIHSLEGTADGTNLTLCIKGGLMVTLVGERLKMLAEYLKEWRVSKVYLYQPGIQKLKDEKAPVIRAIVETSPDVVRKKEAVQ